MKKSKIIIGLVLIALAAYGGYALYHDCEPELKSGKEKVESVIKTITE